MFVAQSGLSRRLAVELLEKMNNPDNPPLYIEKDEDDLEVIHSVQYARVIVKLICRHPETVR